MNTNTRNLIGACSAVSVFGLAFGMSYPLLSLILEGRGVSSSMIGLNAAMGPLGIVIFSSAIPGFAKRFGARRLATTAALMVSVTLLCFRLFESLPAWFVLRFIQGIGMSILFALSEAWIVRFASDSNRGRVVAIYASTLSLSFGAGPMVLVWVGVDGWAPFAIGALVLALGIFPLRMVNDEVDRHPVESEPAGFFRFAPKAPLLLAAVAVFAIFDAASISLFPVYGIRNDLTVTISAALVSALVLGNVLLQFPVGWLADRYPKRMIMIVCSVLTAVMLALLPVVINSPLKWPLLVLIGATGYGIYTVSLSSLGDRFKGDELINGSAAFATVWGCGALFGAATSGWSLNLFDSHGLPFFLALCFILLGLGLWLRRRAVSGR